MEKTTEHESGIGSVLWSENSACLAFGVHIINF